MSNLISRYTVSASNCPHFGIHPSTVYNFLPSATRSESLAPFGANDRSQLLLFCRKPPGKYCHFRSRLNMRLPACNAVNSESDMGNPYHQFILFGDSLIQQSTSQDRGFSLTPALQFEYIRRLDVVNRGFSGFTSAQALKILPRFLPSPSQAHIRFLLIFFGANDAVLPHGPNNQQHVPLAMYKANLRKMINHPKVKTQNPRIILVTPPPVNEYLLGNSNRVAENTKLYADAVQEIGEEEKVAVLNIWSHFMHHSGWQEGQPLAGSKKAKPSEILRTLLFDGLHFSNIGYTLFFQELIKLIEKEFPDQMPTKLPFVFPV